MSDFFERSSAEIIDLEARYQQALDEELVAPRAEIMVKSLAMKQAASFLISSLADRGIGPNTVVYNIPYTPPGPNLYGLQRPVDRFTVHGQGWLLATAERYGAQDHSNGGHSASHRLALCLEQNGQLVNAVYQDDNRLNHTRTLDMGDEAIFDTLGIQGPFVLYTQWQSIREIDKVIRTGHSIDLIENALLVAGKSLLQD